MSEVVTLSRSVGTLAKELVFETTTTGLLLGDGLLVGDGDGDGDIVGDREGDGLGIDSKMSTVDVSEPSLFMPPANSTRLPTDATPIP